MENIKLDLVTIGNQPQRDRLAIAYSDMIEWKRKRKVAIICFLIGCIIGIIPAIFHIESVASNDANLFESPQIVEITYYLETGNDCANGKEPHPGIVAFAPEYIGDTAILYEYNNGKVGDVIGIYEIYDTGFGKHLAGIGSSIKAGKTVDVFMPDNETGKEFIREHGNEVYIQIVKAQG